MSLSIYPLQTKLRKQSAIAMEERLKEEEDIEKEEDGRFYQPFGSGSTIN